MDVRYTDQPASDLAADLLVVGVGSDFATSLADLDARLGGHLLPWLKRQGFSGARGTLATLPTFGSLPSPQLVVVGVGEGHAADLVDAAGYAGREARKVGAATLGLSLPAPRGLERTLVETVAAGNYSYDAYKAEDARKAPLTSLLIAGAGATDAAATVRATWQGWTRDLVNAPPDDLHPEALADAAVALGRLPHVEVEVWDVERCAAEGLVGIVAVGRGSTRPGRFIHVRYTPPSPTAHVALVGKGVTFDSGGLSLKPSPSMQTMRCDMAGAATVLAATAAAAELGLPVRIDTFVGAVENMNDGASYKLGDILRYANGVTVEIHNTDAEGRLVLADCLIQASRVPGVQHIVDAATLTGAAVIALGSDFAGLFTKDEALATALFDAAATTGEGLWRLPLHDPYKASLKADWGRIKNVGARDGGASSAASFLEHFVDVKSWAHLDIAPTAFQEKPTRFWPAGATGELVRTLVTWLERL